MCDPIYSWPVDHLPTRTELVEHFAEWRLHQMEKEGEGNFQMSDFSNEVRCIYHILSSRVHSMISHTIIPKERALCLVDRDPH